MVSWVLWAVLLIVQQFSHGLSSRAKNSNSVTYGVVAATLSNGVWFVSNMILVDNFVKVLRESDWQKGIYLGLFYTAFCVVGSAASQILSMRIEKKWGFR